MEARSSCGLLSLGIVVLCAGGFGQSQANAPVLSLRVPVESLPVAGEVRTWQIAAQAQEFFRIAVQPSGLPLKIRLTAPDGSEAAGVTNRTDETRTISISQVAAQTGSLLVWVQYSETCLWLPVVLRGKKVLGDRAVNIAALEWEMEEIFTPQDAAFPETPTKQEGKESVERKFSATAAGASGRRRAVLGTK